MHAAVELADGWFLTSPAGRSPAGLDLALEACLVEVDGQVTDSGTGAAAAGHPAEALAWAANALARDGLVLEPGWLVLTGPLTAPVPMPPGAPLAIHFTTLGSLFLPPGLSILPHWPGPGSGMTGWDGTVAIVKPMEMPPTCGKHTTSVPRHNEVTAGV